MSLNTIINFARDYQSLIGSFVAVIFASLFWYIQFKFSEFLERKKFGKEIENIFLMATRESEMAFKNVQGYLTEARRALEKHKDEIHLITPTQFSRVYVNEERLFTLKSNLDFIISQQIDIAVSAAKMFNSYLESFEEATNLIFDSNMRLLELGLIDKERAIKEYNADQSQHFKQIEELLKHNMLTAQRHLFRPIVAQAQSRKRPWRKVPLGMADSILDAQAEVMLQAMKIDLSD